MLKIWLIGIILFFINFIALRKFIEDIDDFDEWAMTFLFSLIPVTGIWLNIYYQVYVIHENLGVLFNFEKEYSKSVSDLCFRRKVTLSYDQIKKFYVVNPELWTVSSDGILIYYPERDMPFVIFFKNVWEYWLTMAWIGRHSKKEKAAASNTAIDEDMSKFLEYIRRDIDTKKREAEKEIEAVEKCVKNSMGLNNERIV